DAGGNSRSLCCDGSHRRARDAWSPFSASVTYGRTGLLTGATWAPGTGSPLSYTIASAAGQGIGMAVSGAPKASVTDGLSHTTTYLLDGRGRLLQMVQPDGATTTSRRDFVGQVVAAVDPVNIPTLYPYAYGASAGDLTEMD